MHTKDAKVLYSAVSLNVFPTSGQKGCLDMTTAGAFGADELIFLSGRAAMPGTLGGSAPAPPSRPTTILFPG